MAKKPKKRKNENACTQLADYLITSTNNATRTFARRTLREFSVKLDGLCAQGYAPAVRSDKTWREEVEALITLLEMRNAISRHTARARLFAWGEILNEHEYHCALQAMYSK